MSPQRGKSSSASIDKIKNIQLVERRNWKGIYPPTVGHKLQKNENSLETILTHLSKTQIKAAQEATDSFRNKTEHVPRLSGCKKEIRSMVVLTALLKVLKMKNFKIIKHRNKRSESRNKEAKRKDRGHSKRKKSEKRPSTGSMCKRNSTALPDENSMIKSKMRKYGYYFEQENEDKGYEVIKFKCIKESEMVKKTEYQSSMYSKFNRIIHLDNSSA